MPEASDAATDAVLEPEELEWLDERIAEYQELLYQDPSARAALEQGFADAQSDRIRRSELRSDSKMIPATG